MWFTHSEINVKLELNAVWYYRFTIYYSREHIQFSFNITNDVVYRSFVTNHEDLSLATTNSDEKNVIWENVVSSI